MKINVMMIFVALVPVILIIWLICSLVSTSEEKTMQKCKNEVVVKEVEKIKYVNKVINESIQIRNAPDVGYNELVGLFDCGEL